MLHVRQCTDGHVRHTVNETIIALQIYCFVSKYLPVCYQPHGPIITERLTVIQLVKKFHAFMKNELISDLPINFMHAASPSSI